MKNSHCLEMMAEMLKIYATIEAMKAKNIEREIAGFSLAYGEDAFMTEARRAQDVRAQIVQMTGG